MTGPAIVARDLRMTYGETVGLVPVPFYTETADIVEHFTIRGRNLY